MCVERIETPCCPLLDHSIEVPEIFFVSFVFLCMQYSNYFFFSNTGGKQNSKMTLEISAGSGIVKHESKCSCEGILQMQLRFKISWL